MGQDADPHAAAPEASNDVRLQAVVDDRDERAVLVAPDVRHRRRRDLGDEVLVLPARHGLGARHGVRTVKRARFEEHPAEAAVGPKVPGQRPRVHPGDRRDRVVAQEPRELTGVVEHGRGRVRDDEPAKPWPRRLVVGEEPAVIADQRVGHDDDLARIGRVGADLLVARLAGVDDEVAAGRDRRPERHALEDGAVLQREEGRPGIADARVDDRARARAGRCGKGNLAGLGARQDARSHSASFPASRNRSAGLTEPAQRTSEAYQSTRARAARMAAGTGGGHVGRRLGTLRGTLVLAIAALLAVAGCGAANPDPYAVIDQARTANYDRIQVNLGFTAEIAAQGDPNFPEMQMPATSINVDPSWITAAADLPTGRWYVRLDSPARRAGHGQPRTVRPAIRGRRPRGAERRHGHVCQEPAAADGVPGRRRPGRRGRPDRLGPARLGRSARAPRGPDALPVRLLGGAPALPGPLPIPPAGDAAALRTLVTEVGGTVEYAGTETVNGVELVHLKGGLNIVKLVQSQQFMNLTGLGRDQLGAIAAMEGKIGVGADIWVNKASGRLTTLRIEGTSIEAPVATVVLTLQIAEPGPDVTFEAPAAFTDVNLADLIGNSFSGNEGGGVGPMATPSPEEQEIIDDILDEVGEELEDELPTTP